MKSPTQPSKKPSMPLLFQSFGCSQNFHSNYSSRLKPKHRPSDISSPQPSSECDSNFRMACQSSRKNLQVQSTAIQEHYENMQKILLSQNLNLKQQNAFLTSQIRRSIKHQQKLKQQKKNAIIEIKQLTIDSNRFQNELTRSKQFIQNQLSYIAQTFKSNNIQQVKNIVLRFIDSVCAQFQFQIQKYLNHSYNQVFFDKGFEEGENKGQLEQEIDALTKKLEQLLEEDHNPNKGPLIRRQCIELSKQIKNLKEKSRVRNESVHLNVAQSVPNNSHQRSSLQSSNSNARDNITMKRQIWHSQISKQQAQDGKNNYPTQIYSKVTQRKSINRENKSLRQSSPAFYKSTQNRFK